MGGPERDELVEREAVRRAQRIARQLHQVLAASIALAALRDEEELLKRLAERVRGVFDAVESVVALDTGPAAPLRVTAGRGGPALADEREVLPFEVDPSGPGRHGPWLVAPIPLRRRGARGSIGVRRSDDVGFGPDDGEILTLLAQMASSALDAAELDRAIASSEARWRVLVETAPIGIVETDARGAVRWWNRAAGTLFGWMTEDGGTATLPAAVLSQVEPLWQGARAAPVTADLEPVELDGRRRDLSVAAALLESPDGAAPSMLTLVADETDKRQLLDELRHAQRMEVIGQLSSSVAHDFNNLLTLIAGYAELLHHETGESQRAAQLIVDIVATTTRAKTLTGKLLTMGRSKVPAPVVFSPVATVGALAEVLDRIVGAAISVTLELDPSAGNVRADPDQFEQTVLNLAVNARDAMPDGGELAIRVSALDIADAPGPLGVDAGSYVELTVRDSGLGMDEDTAAMCFEPLFTTKGPGKGTGLGLPAARRVVTEAGGAIAAESAPGEGTTFRILLPAVDEQVTQPAAAEPAERTPQSGTVLLAEDEDGIRTMVSRVLSHDGFDVLEADSGEAAIQLAEAHPGAIDLLVSDVVMGGITGIELAARLQARWPDLQVVLVSGNVESSVLDALRPGSASFLAKPFRPSQLVEVVRELRASRERAGE